MLNEGMITGDQGILIKSEMLRHLRAVGRSTSVDMERAVFEALTDGRPEDLDWEYEDNKAGYFLWVKAFDQLIDELVEDGYARVETDGEKPVLVPVEREDGIRYSQGVS